MLKQASFIVWALAALLTLSGAAFAQGPCPLIDDGFFSGGCCSTPLPNLPQFPPIQVDGRYGCIRDCSLEAQFANNITLDFQWILCDYALIFITVTPGGPGAPSFTGTLLAKYSRTWVESPVPGVVPAQVWRFLINGDLQFGTGAPAPCPTPPEAVTGLLVNMTGSIDYICDPFSTAPSYLVRMNLNHFNGCISHAPFSTFALGGALAHTDRSYHLVAPSNFSFTPTIPPSGPLVAEAVRPSLFGWSPFFYDCRTESRMPQGQLQNVNALCYGCPAPAAAPSIYTDQSMSGIVACAGSVSPFSTVPIPGILGSGLLTLSLGFYTPTSTLPWGQEVFVHWGVVDYTDACNGRGPIHVVTGVTTHSPNNPGTLFPNPLFPPPPPLATFMDLSNVLILPIYPGQTLNLPPYPGWGSLYAADLVWNLNIP